MSSVINVIPYKKMTEEQRTVLKNILKDYGFRLEDLRLKIQADGKISGLKYDDMVIRFVYNNKMRYCLASGMVHSGLTDIYEDIKSHDMLFDRDRDGDWERDEELEKIINRNIIHEEEQ